VSRLLQDRDLPENNNNNASKEDILAEYTIGLEGHFGAHEITPRELNASNIGQLMLVEGIVTKCKLSTPARSGDSIGDSIATL
jgi:DNA replication licensing factor MCM3